MLTISGTNSNPSIIKFNRANAAINRYWTKITAEVIQSTGSFGFGFRVGNRAGFADDGFYVFNKNIGLSSYGFSYNVKKNGAWISPAPTGHSSTSTNWLTNGSPMQVSSWIAQNDTSGFTMVYLQTTSPTITQSVGYGVTTSFYFDSANTGGVAIYSQRTAAAATSVTKFTLATSTTLSVSLFSCINDTTWTTMFRSLTGCNSCTVTARAAGENARCKAAGAKEAASAFIVVIESSTVASEAIATNFIAAVESGSVAVAPLAVKTAAIVPGIEGAVLAGLPEVAPIIVGTGAGAGAGGGAAGGLSGGAIAGIVIGSVAGAVLIVGVTAIVVAAVIVAAVVVAKKAGSDDSESSRAEPEPNRRASIRDTIYNIFRAPRGGVDVMNNPSGHQSITARAPKM